MNKSISFSIPQARVNLKLKQKAMHSRIKYKNKLVELLDTFSTMNNGNIYYQFICNVSMNFLYAHIDAS